MVWGQVLSEARYQCTFHYLSFLHVKILIRCFLECMFWSGEKEENMTSLEPLGERWICHWWHKTSMYYFDSLVWKLFIFSKVTQKKKGKLFLGKQNRGEMPPSQSVTPCGWACDLGLTICCHLEIFIWSKWCSGRAHSQWLCCHWLTSVGWQGLQQQQK